MTAVAIPARTVTFSADDFGLTPSVNAGIERAHRDGILQAASLMVGAPAADEAVRIAHANPRLRVGLHLVVIEGPAVLPPAEIPDLVDAGGQFPSNQLTLGLNYFFRPRIRRQLRAEIHAQYAAFAKTGLALDHANAHKHMHLHPTVGAMMLAVGREFGLRRIRVPAEPPAVMARCGTPVGWGDRALYRWTSRAAPSGARRGDRHQRLLFRVSLERPYDRRTHPLSCFPTFLTGTTRSTSIRPPHGTRCWIG